MKCPHCGEFVDNVLWKALAPYRAEKLPVVITNVDAWKEVGALWMRELKGESKEKEGKKKEGGES